MSKQSKWAAWQSPEPKVIEATKPEPKATKIIDALTVPSIEVPDTVNEVAEVKPEFKKLKKIKKTE
jgi:hypothetical protein